VTWNSTLNAVTSLKFGSQMTECLLQKCIRITQNFTKLLEIIQWRSIRSNFRRTREIRRTVMARMNE